MGPCYELVANASEPDCFFSCGEDGVLSDDFFWTHEGPLMFATLLLYRHRSTIRPPHEEQLREAAVRVIPVASLLDATVLETDSSLLCHSCDLDVLINCRRSVTSVSLHPFRPLLAVACADGCVRLYDRRALATRASSGASPRYSVKGLVARFAPDSVLAASDPVPVLEARRLMGPSPHTSRSQRITSLQFSSSGEQLLASYSADALYLIDSERTRDLAAGTTRAAHERSVTGAIATCAPSRRLVRHGPAVEAE